MLAPQPHGVSRASTYVALMIAVPPDETVIICTHQSFTSDVSRLGSLVIGLPRHVNSVQNGYGSGFSL